MSGFGKLLGLYLCTGKCHKDPPQDGPISHGSVIIYKFLITLLRLVEKLSRIIGL